MTQHPLSAAFPAMGRADFLALVEDIARHGLRQPAIAFEGQILDGWHRYRACIEAGVTPRVDVLEADVDPVALVLSLNLSRRHLTPSQRAAAVVACATWREIGNNQYSLGSAPGSDPDANVSVKELAKQADVSTRTIEQAKKAQRAGLGEVVRDGGMSAKAAAALASEEAPPVRAGSNRKRRTGARRSCSRR
jgi:hypothetical protein